MSSNTPLIKSLTTQVYKNEIILNKKERLINTNAIMLKLREIVAAQLERLSELLLQNAF